MDHSEHAPGIRAGRYHVGHNGFWNHVVDAQLQQLYSYVLVFKQKCRVAAQTDDDEEETVANASW
jgi:hypothetical protein